MTCSKNQFFFVTSQVEIESLDKFANRMKKSDTVARYIDDFLKGKSEDVQERFREKSLDKQYSSIMQWRSKQRRKDQPVAPGTDLLNDLKAIKAKLQKAPEITGAECRLLYAEMDGLRQALALYEEERKQRRIRELEAQKEAIARELQSLRGNEPGLFDNLDD